MLQNISNTIDITKDTYEKVDYDELPHRQGNLRILETIGDIYQIAPPDIRAARVLELGTGTGNTLLAQAEAFPNTEFIGIDLAEKHIQIARSRVRELGLKNVEFRCVNMLDIDESWGEFDYIIAHGVYSWVPPIVQEKMLDICKILLSPRGIGMFSYNTYPGWKFHQVVRELMFFHATEANRYETPQQQIEQGRSILNFLAEETAPKKNYHSLFLNTLGDHIKTVSDHYIFHEYFEPENHPCYFVDFYRELRERELAYISDTNWQLHTLWRKVSPLGKLLPRSLPFELAEQYLDYAMNRTFRSSVFCREQAKNSMGLRKDIHLRYRMYIPQNAKIEEDIESNTWVIDIKGIQSRIDRSPFNDTVVRFFSENRYRNLGFEQVWHSVKDGFTSERIGGDSNRNELQNMFVRLIESSFLQPILHHPQGVDIRLPDRPKLARFIRYLARSERRMLPNHLYEHIRTDPVMNFVISFLDGRNTTGDIVTKLETAIRNGKLRLEKDNGVPVNDRDREVIRKIVSSTINEIFKHQLL